MLYFSLVYSVLTYGILIWGSTSITFLQKLSILQKKIIRVITDSEWNAHTSVIFKDLEIIKFNDLFQYLLNIYMYKSLSKDKNNYLLKKIHDNNIEHTYCTRGKVNIRLPLFTKTMCQRSLVYLVAKK